ncbi:MAG TPA: thioesterase family protein [Gemmatimonadaceae bacterium]|nr:thioesterase family protein [Gemmatimonadaceae bacterium]
MARPFVVNEYVRWGDIDLAGIICYGAYIRFFEIAEEEIFRAAGLPMKQMFDRYDLWLPRKVMHAEFFAPAVLDERLEVVTYFSRIGTTSLTINFDVFGPERTPLHAAAHEVVVCVSRAEMRKKPLPPDVVRAIEPFTMTSEAARSAAAPPAR